MYKIVYDIDDGRRNSTEYRNAATYAGAQLAIKELISRSDVTDIYLCRQVNYINACVERRKI